MIWSEGSRPVWGECGEQQRLPLSPWKRPAARESSEGVERGEERGKGEGRGGRGRVARSGREKREGGGGGRTTCTHGSNILCADRSDGCQLLRAMASLWRMVG